MEEYDRIRWSVQFSALARRLHLKNVANFPEIHSVANGISNLTRTKSAPIGHLDVTWLNTIIIGCYIVELESNGFITIGEGEHVSINNIGTGAINLQVETIGQAFIEQYRIGIDGLASQTDFKLVRASLYLLNNWNITSW